MGHKERLVYRSSSKKSSYFLINIDRTFNGSRVPIKVSRYKPLNFVNGVHGDLIFDD